MAYTRMPDAPLRRMQSVTKSDVTEYDPPIMLLRVASAGALTVLNIEGNSVLISAVLAGEYVPGPFSKIMSTGTDAAGFTGWLNE